MLDGIYQSVVCFYFCYLLFEHPATFASQNGLDVENRTTMGVYIAHVAVLVVNVYILLNTYRWDWLMLLLSTFSVLLIWFWNGVYTASTYSAQFYKGGPQAYGQLSFWALHLVTPVACLFPRFACKAFQKIYLPMDVDIIREQVRQGKFKALDDLPPDTSAAKLEAAARSSEDKGAPPNGAGEPLVDGISAKKGTQSFSRGDDRRPIYPPSTAPAATVHHGSTNGSDSTNDTAFRRSIDRVRTAASGGGNFMPLHEAPSSVSGMDPPPRPSFDRPRPSFDRMRSSLDIVRASFEASPDMTTANRLMRLESSQSDVPSERRGPGPSHLR